MFADADHGWAVGCRYDRCLNLYWPVVTATSDGGHSWIATNPLVATPSQGAHQRLRSVAFVDATHGWAVGSRMDWGGYDSEGPTILATSDGGQSWSEQDRPIDWGGLHSVSFVDALHGWAVGQAHHLEFADPDDLKETRVSNGLLLLTSDGGQQWSAQEFDTVSSFASVCFTDTLHGWAVGRSCSAAGPSPGSVIMATGDGGKTWGVQRQVTDGTTLSSIRFADSLHGWAVGYVNPVDDVRPEEECDPSSLPVPVILATSDGGQSWTVQDPGPLECAPQSLFATDAMHCWVVGGGTIGATDDGGATWRTQYSDAQEDLLAVAFPDAVHGWVSGGDGTILATTDGGTPPIDTTAPTTTASGATTSGTTATSQWPSRPSTTRSARA